VAQDADSIISLFLQPASVERLPGFGSCASGSPCLAEIAVWPPAHRAYGSERHGTIHDMGELPPGGLEEVNIV
jgi:hypothetical protein